MPLRVQCRLFFWKTPRNSEILIFPFSLLISFTGISCAGLSFLRCMYLVDEWFSGPMRLLRRYMHAVHAQ